MGNFRWVTPEFAVAPQLGVADLAEAARLGFKTLIANRPDDEQPGQPSLSQMETAAAAVGLQFKALPFQGAPPPSVVSAMASALDTLPQPVLAYCRTGTRSIMAWAMAKALAGEETPTGLITRAGEVGYDLSAMRVALDALAPRS